MGVEFESGEIERLGRYLALLLHASEVMNLTAIREPEAAWEKHILDALSLMPLLAELADGATVIDVGSGGGVPGIPVAIVQRRLKIVLVEATQKKAAFLESCAARLGLGNVQVLAERAEVAAHGPLRESADLVMARAVGRLATLVELSLPLAPVGGRVALIKGAAAQEEIAEAQVAIRTLGGGPAQTIQTPTGRIVVIEKARPTPRTYPRRSGEPKRAPIGAGKR